MAEKSFRRRVISSIAGTQEQASEIVGIRQSNISLWCSRHPESGSMAELMELALAELSDEQLRQVLTEALQKRADRG